MTSDLDTVYDSTLYFASLASITFLSASTFSSFEALYETCAWLKAAPTISHWHRGRRRLTVLRGFLELLEQLVPILILPQAGVLMRGVSDVSDMRGQRDTNLIPDIGHFSLEVCLEGSFEPTLKPESASPYSLVQIVLTSGCLSIKPAYGPSISDSPTNGRQVHYLSAHLCAQSVLVRLLIDDLQRLQHLIQTVRTQLVNLDILAIWSLDFPKTQWIVGRECCRDDAARR